MSTTEMREPTFFILISLAEGRKHGYGIIKDAAELSAGRVTLAPGTLYNALDRLQSDDLVAAAGDEVVGGRLRRYFELTELGAMALGEESERQAANSRQALTRLRQRATRGFGTAVTA